MFRRDQETRHAPPPSLCRVMNRLPADCGTHEHFLVVERPTNDRFLRNVTWLDDLELPAIATLAGPNQTAALHVSERVRHALMQLHARQGFDAITFEGSLGFRTLQARRAGLGFEGVALRVTPIEAVERWPASADDLFDAFAESYALRHADVDHAPSVPRCASTPLVTVSVAHYNLGDYLAETLASLAEQTYPALEMQVIDDGSTEAHAQACFDRLERQYPRFQFLRQSNRGIGATRNRGLELAHGQYFLPVDADNLARPDMVERFVRAAQCSPEVAVWTCYFLAFQESPDVEAGRFAYAYRPTGGPRLLGALKNVYGDGNALYRTDALRSVGGYRTDRGTSWEDWEVLALLANQGHRVEVVPEPLFYYRHRDAGFSRSTNSQRNHQRVLRSFASVHDFTPAEQQGVWQTLAGLQQRLEAIEADNRALRTQFASARYALADRLCRSLRRSALLHRFAKRLLGSTRSPAETVS